MEKPTFEIQEVTFESDKWKDLKTYLIETHREYQDRNGLPYCKNCGVDHKELVKQIEEILDQQKKESSKIINKIKLNHVKERNKLAEACNRNADLIDILSQTDKPISSHTNQLIEEFRKTFGGEKCTVHCGCGGGVMETFFINALSQTEQECDKKWRLKVEKLKEKSEKFVPFQKIHYQSALDDLLI